MEEEKVGKSGEKELKQSEPKDRYKLIYFIMLLHGVGLLLPWNMFANAKSYFIDYKLHENYTDDPTPYGQYFMSILGFAAMVPNFILNWLNIFIKWKASVRARIIWCIIIQITIFFGNIIMVLVNSSGWPKLFLALTMIGVIIINSTIGIYQSSLFGFAGKLPAKYIGAIVLGNNSNGACVALISMFSDAVMQTQKTSAILYFTIAITFLFFTLTTIFLLKRNKYYRFHSVKKLVETSENDTTVNKEKIPYWYIFKKGFRMYICVFLTLFVSLAIFPALQSFIQRSDENFFIPLKYYTNILCFFTYNFFTMIGSLVAPFILWPKAKFIWIPVVIRLLLIPMFIFCNYQPPGVLRRLPILIADDFGYWFLSALNGVSSGYLTSLTMMYVPGCVEQEHGSVASMFGSAMLFSGIFCGVCFSFIYPSIILIDFGTETSELVKYSSDEYGFYCHFYQC